MKRRFSMILLLLTVLVGCSAEQNTLEEPKTIEQTEAEEEIMEGYIKSMNRT